MFNTARTLERRRTEQLLSRGAISHQAESSGTHDGTTPPAPPIGLRLYLSQAGMQRMPAGVFFFLAAAAGAAAALGAAQVLSRCFVPAAALLGAALPWFWLERRAAARAAAFAADYPSVLLAAASSIKAGMTTPAAFERAVALLPAGSLCRQEVESLLASLARGTAKEQAIAGFGRTIRQADLELFRRAFSLSLENGGRFAPTLERLARVCRDREVLMRTAQVSTATMRMTANVLAVIAPVIVMMLAVRTKNFWDLLLYHPVANTMGSLGAMIIISGFLILRRMSSFRP